MIFSLFHYWGNTCPSSTLPVLLELKKAVRIIVGARYLDQTEILFYYMKLLTVSQIIELQSLTVVHKVFKELLPINLQYLFNLHISNKRYKI